MVADSGPGLDPEQAGRVFQRGYSTKSTDRPLGRGIGLALVAQAAHRHGGAVAVANEKGAVFTVTATVLWFGFGAHFAALALVAVLAVFATLESAFGLCVGCRVFYLGMRLGLVPPHVCEDCLRMLAA